MKALTVRQPWASLEIGGLKPVENRTWPVPSTLSQWWKCPLCPEKGRWPWTSPLDNPPVCAGEHELEQMDPDGPFPFRLWIHAGQSYDYAANIWRRVADATGLWRSRDWDADVLPAGVLLGYVTVTDCHHADACRVRHTTLDPRSFSRPSQFPPGTLSPHAPVGYCSPWAEPNAYHWTLADPQALAEPVPMRGRQGLWNVPDDALAAVQP